MFHEKNAKADNIWGTSISKAVNNAAYIIFLVFQYSYTLDIGSKSTS